ncbi:MAG TPA: low specificity L-threonine aldolase [Hyphomicrobiales bacterium]|nr:low specificity L-threonine aldolase [Hyphomicrobiales bacterium]
MNFASDNVFGVHPRIIEALNAANAGTAVSYGDDDWTKRAEKRLCEVFECDLRAFLVVTGTAANSLALSAMAPPYGAVLCHAESHIMVDECGAPELFTGGAKLIGLDEPGGKITAGAIERKLDGFIRNVHDAKPAAISITQASEAGTVYAPAEIEAISRVARARGLRLHMDGARFANALVSLACTPAELTWKAGVDALSFGATKNGAMALEAVVFFDMALAEDFGHRRMRAGQLLSKGRFLGAQMLAYLEDDLWLDNARHANAMAQRLAKGLAKGMASSQAHLLLACEANEVFAIMPRSLHGELVAAGVVCHQWPGSDHVGPDEILTRFVTSYLTKPEDVDRLLELVG